MTPHIKVCHRGHDGQHEQELHPPRDLNMQPLSKSLKTALLNYLFFGFSFFTVSMLNMGTFFFLNVLPSRNSMVSRNRFHMGCLDTDICWLGKKDLPNPHDNCHAGFRIFQYIPLDAVGWMLLDDKRSRSLQASRRQKYVTTSWETQQIM